MSQLLAIYRITRDKLFDYYYNGFKNETNRENTYEKGYIYKIYDFLTEPDLIFENDDNIKIYLGNSYNAANFYTLDDLNIDSIINVSLELPNYFEDDFNYLQIPITDTNDEIIDPYFEKAQKFIKNEIKKGNKNFFFHCYYGASRSAIFVIYILMNVFNLSYLDAETLVKKREVVNINLSFIDRLKNNPN